MIARWKMIVPCVLLAGVPHSLFAHSNRPPIAHERPLTKPVALSILIQYYQLQHLDARGVAKLLNGLFAPIPGQSHLYADFDTRTNTVVFTGPADQMAAALHLVEIMDKLSSK